MNTLNHKNISAALLLMLSTVFSFNSYAAETTSIENSISELVIEQGKQAMNEISEQLQQSITKDINSFTSKFSLDESFINALAWLKSEEKTPVNIEN